MGVTGKVPTGGVKSLMKHGGKGLAYMAKSAFGQATKFKWKQGDKFKKSIPGWGMTKAAARGTGRFMKKHPFLAGALPAGFAGGAGAGMYSASQNRHRNGAMEGHITSVRGFQYGSMAPSMQFAQTPGMSKRFSNRSGNRVTR